VKKNSDPDPGDKTGRIRSHFFIYKEAKGGYSQQDGLNFQETFLIDYK
jgi:hypothetical protein